MFVRKVYFGVLELFSILHLRSNYWAADLSDFLGAAAVVTKYFQVKE